MPGGPTGDVATSRVVLVRFSGDVSTKARATRYRMTSRLLHNLRDALATEGCTARVRITHDRIFVEDPGAAGIHALARVFGVQSVALAERLPGADLDAVVRRGAALFRDRVAGRRFAVRARRVGPRDRVSLAPRDVERELGAALLPHAAGVDLDDPDVTLHVELLPDGACLVTEQVPGPGGLPLGVEGRAVALVSGGFDSAVAAWYLMKRGVALDYVFCNLGGLTHRQGALAVTKVLGDRWSYGDRPRFVVLDFDRVADSLRERTARRYWQVLLKRWMLRAGARMAKERRAAALVTGEAVGQVSSQTLTNLAVIDEATDAAVLRPLVGFNKEEILAVARRIGTFELAKAVAEYCAMVPRRPATSASLGAIEAEEAKLGAEVLERVLEKREVLDLRDLPEGSLDPPHVSTDRVPEGATVVDLRTKAEYDTWHYPGAVRLDFAEALRAWPVFDRQKTYVLYCEVALKSAHLAEMMRREGFDAHHFRGGARALRRHADS